VTYSEDTPQAGVHADSHNLLEAIAFSMTPGLDGQSITGATGVTGVPGVEYSAIILQDSPIAYWRLGESSGSVIDEVASLSLAVSGTPIYSVSGALQNDPDTAVQFQSTEYFLNASGVTPTAPYSVEMWFKATSGINGTAGGVKLSLGTFPVRFCPV